MAKREDIVRRIRRQAKSHHGAGFDEFGRDLDEVANEVELLREVIQGAESYVTFRYQCGVEVLDMETEWTLTKEQAEAVGRALALRSKVAP